ncbi:hypothetical protein [Anaerotignum sp.]
MAGVAAESTAMTAVAASSTAMTAVAASSTAMTAVAASSTAMTAVAASTVAITAIEAKSDALAILASSPLKKSTTVATTTSFGSKISGNVFVISVNQSAWNNTRTVSLRYTTVGDSTLTFNCSDCYSTNKAVRRFFDGLNMCNSYSDLSVSVTYIDC